MYTCVRADNIQIQLQKMETCITYTRACQAAIPTSIHTVMMPALLLQLLDLHAG